MLSVKRAALRHVDHAQIKLQEAYDLLGFYPYPDTISQRLVLGLDTREEVQGNHGRTSVESFPTERGKRFDELRERIRALNHDVSVLYDELLLPSPPPVLKMLSEPQHTHDAKCQCRGCRPNDRPCNCTWCRQHYPWKSDVQT